MAKIILVVDDSRTMRLMTATTLRNGGFKVLEAQDGKDALEILSMAAVDLIISDLHMPNMNGLELVENVRSHSRHKDVPILLLTTESDPQKKEQGKRAKASGWITKPFSPESLVQVTHKVIGGE